MKQNIEDYFKVDPATRRQMHIDKLRESGWLQGAEKIFNSSTMEENNFKAQQMNKIQPETIIALVKNVGRDISTEEAIRLLEAMETMVEIAGTAPVITKQVLDPVDNERVMNARRNETDDTLLRMQLLQLHYVVQDLIAGWIVS